MSRHQLRLLAVQILYEWDFYNYDQKRLDQIVASCLLSYHLEPEDSQFIQRLVRGVQKYLPQIDKVLQKAAPQWSVERMNLVDRNILRLGLFELLYNNVPPKVAIDEAIELGKDFSGVVAGKFINGVLGTVYEEMKKLKKEKK